MSIFFKFFSFKRSISIRKPVSLSLGLYFVINSKFFSRYKTIDNSPPYLEEKLTKKTKYLEVEVCQSSDIFPKSIKIIKNPLNNKSIYVTNLNGKYYAFSGHCPYDDSLLIKDLILGERVFCSEHLSSFSIKTGNIEDGPDMEDLMVYEVLEKNNGALFLKIPENIIDSKVINYKKIYGIPNFDRYVFVGNDPSIVTCIQNLRIAGFLGEITMIISTNDNELPYDFRKKLRTGNGFLRGDDFYNKFNIRVIRESIKHINMDLSEIEFEKLDNYKYTKMIMATGITHKFVKLNNLGAENIFFLKNFEEFNRINELNYSDKIIVILGANFSSLELAYSLRRNKNKITILDKNEVPCQKLLGKNIGEIILQDCQRNNIVFLGNSQMNSIEINEKGAINKILLANGDEKEVDALIFLGDFFPNTNLVKENMRICKDGGLYSDILLKSTRYNIFSLGGVSCFPSFIDSNRISIRNNVSEGNYQSFIVAMNLLEKYFLFIKLQYFKLENCLICMFLSIL